MTNELYEKLRLISKKITKNDELTDDLFHDVLIQLANNKKYELLTDKQKIFYFVRAISNQYYSTTSYFYKTYKRIRTLELNTDINILQEEYEETPSIDFINNILNQEILNNQDNWYNVGLFRLYIESKNINKLNKETKIPKYSIRLTIKIMKDLLNKKWEEYKLN